VRRRHVGLAVAELDRARHRLGGRGDLDKRRFDDSGELRAHSRGSECTARVADAFAGLIRWGKRTRRSRTPASVTGAQVVDARYIASMAPASRGAGDAA